MGKTSEMERSKEEYEVQAYGFSINMMNKSIADLVHNIIISNTEHAKNSTNVNQTQWGGIVADVLKHSDNIIAEIQAEITKQWSVPSSILLKEDQYMKEENTNECQNDIIVSRIAEETILRHMLQEAQEVHGVLEQAEQAHGYINKILKDMDRDCEKLVEKLNHVKPE